MRAVLPRVHDAQASSSVLKRLLKNASVQAAFARGLAAYLSFTIRANRWEFHGIEHLAALAEAGAPVIIAFWHQRLPLMPALWLKEQQLPGRALAQRKVHVLVSRHRDGRLVGTIMKHFGMELIYASSSKGGASGLRAMLNLLKRRQYVAITPDGPRGPAHIAAPGVAQLAALSNAVILPCSAQTSRRHTLHTWDRMAIPKPFGRGVIVCGAPIAVDRLQWRQALDVITAALNEVSERADQLCA